MKKFIFISLILITFVGCSVNSSKLSQDYANDFVEDMTFAKEKRSGLCFGMVASRKTMSTDSSGLGITEVPCSKIIHLIGE